MVAPLLVLAGLLLRREGWWGRPGLSTERLRFRRMGAGDWGWSLAAFAAVGVGYAEVVMAGKALLESRRGDDWEGGSWRRPRAGRAGAT